MEAEEFPSIQDRPALQTWRGFIDHHLENWSDEKRRPLAGVPSNAVPISPVAAWRPTNFDRPAEDMPQGWCSLGHDPESIADHLQVQSALHAKAVDEAVSEWSRTWLRPRLKGEADIYFQLRLNFASHIVHGLLAGVPLPIDLSRDRPALTDYPQSLKWILITLWERAGDHFLQYFADRERARMRFKIDPGQAESR